MGQKLGLQRHLRVMVVQEISEQWYRFHDELGCIRWQLPANIGSSRQCNSLEECMSTKETHIVSRSKQCTQEKQGKQKMEPRGMLCEYDKMNHILMKKVGGLNSNKYLNTSGKEVQIRQDGH